MGGWNFGTLRPRLPQRPCGLRSLARRSTRRGVGLQGIPARDDDSPRVSATITTWRVRSSADSLCEEAAPHRSSAVRAHPCELGDWPDGTIKCEMVERGEVDIAHERFAGPRDPSARRT